MDYRDRLVTEEISKCKTNSSTTMFQCQCDLFKSFPECHTELIWCDLSDGFLNPEGLIR